MQILAINCGSSSLKFAIVDTTEGRHLLGGLEELGGSNHARALDAVLARVEAERGSLAAIGHRVVHGGEAFRASVRIDARVLKNIEALCDLAPLHNPANLLAIRRLRTAFPELPQVAVFDTAFHQSLPPHAYLYALPRSLHRDHGIRRYGFHGTSHRYVAEEATGRFDLCPENGRIVTAHLGNGCSTAAVLGGRCVDTSMGFSPLEGLVMGTRSGDVDPGLHHFLGRRLQLDPDAISDLLNRKSGLLGLSELSGDMRELERAETEGHEGAALAIEIFCYRLAGQIARHLVALGGLDALILTGGIGENSSRVRGRVMEWLAPLGFELDAEKNARHGSDSGGRISCGGPPLAAVISTDEERLIASETAAVLIN
jgi:acetate kinase